MASSVLIWSESWQPKENTAIRIIDNLSVGTREELAAVCDFTELNASRGAFAPLVSRSEPSLPELVVGDILNEDIALKIARGADVIVHLAADTGVGPSVEDPASRLPGQCDRYA